MKDKLATWVHYDPYGDGAFHADTVFETQHETTSRLLGPDGRPLRYQQPQPIGFDLRKNK